VQTSDLDAANADIKSLHASLQARSGELGESRAEVRHLKDVIVTKTEEINRNNAEIARLRDTVAGKVSELERAATDATNQARVLSDRDAEITVHKTKIADLEHVVQSKEKSRQELMARLESSSSQLSSLSGDKDIVVTKLTDDLAKVMGELQRVQNQLHKAQDMVAYLDPFARVVIDIREKQRKWDAEHDLISTGASAAGASPFGKLSAGRKLGPRPTLTL
jgi:chromosome segregation ATPase